MLNNSMVCVYFALQVRLKTTCSEYLYPPFANFRLGLGTRPTLDLYTYFQICELILDDFTVRKMQAKIAQTRMILKICISAKNKVMQHYE